jgi:hypothetical protein
MILCVENVCTRDLVRIVRIVELTFSFASFRDEVVEINPSKKAWRLYTYLEQHGRIWCWYGSKQLRLCSRVLRLGLGVEV